MSLKFFPYSLFSFLSEGGEELIPMKTGVPEVPNFITLLYYQFHDKRWAQFLHIWENVIFSILLALLIFIFAFLAIRRKSWIPTGWQNLCELFVEQLNRLISDVLGGEAKTYLPFLGTLFIYILVMNIAGLVPFLKSPSSSINVTAALSLCVFSFVQYLNIKNMGIFGFLYHMASSPKTVVAWALAPLMFFLEFIAQLARPVTLALRLFGNILGEDILIGAFALLGVVLLAAYQPPVGLPLQIPFMFLGLLTSLMQALVFTLLSTVYILLSMPHKEH